MPHMAKVTLELGTEGSSEWKCGDRDQPPRKGNESQGMRAHTGMEALMLGVERVL